MQTTMTKNIALAGHAGSGKTTLCELCSIRAVSQNELEKSQKATRFLTIQRKKSSGNPPFIQHFPPFAPMPYRSIFWIHPECLTLPER